MVETAYQWRVGFFSKIYLVIFIKNSSTLTKYHSPLFDQKAE